MKNNKIILILIIITIFLLPGIILGIVLNGNYSKQKMNYYKDKEIRINYFNEHKKSFGIIARVFNDNPSIKSVKYKKDICNSNEDEFKISNEISLCVITGFNENLDNKVLEQSILDLDEIVKISRREVLDDNNNYVGSAVSFYIISSVNGNINYNYCLSNKECDSENNYSETKDGIFEKNKIDEKWSSIFNSIPSM